MDNRTEMLIMTADNFCKAFNHYSKHGFMVQDLSYIINSDESIDLSFRVEKDASSNVIDICGESLIKCEIESEFRYRIKGFYESKETFFTKAKKYFKSLCKN